MMLMSIAALATDPATIALCGSIGGGLLLKGTETVLSKRKKVEEPRMTFMEIANSTPVGQHIEDMADAILTDDSFGGCTLEFQRAFEQKFIDAGIPTTLSKCYDERCETCHPPVRKEAPAIGTVNDRRCDRCKRMFRDMPRRQQKIYTRDGKGVCGHCLNAKTVVPHGVDRLKSLEAEKRRAKEAFDKSRAGKKRVAEVGGRVVPLPNNVPKWATGTLVYDPAYLRDDIVWTWTLDGDPHGKPMAYRQHIDWETFKQFPMAGKKEPFTIKGGNQMIVCRNCNDTYYVRPGSTGPVDTFTCKRCKDVGGSHKNMFDILHAEHEKYKQQIKAEEYKLNEYKKEINYLNEQMNKVHNLPKDRIGSERKYM